MSTRKTGSVSRNSKKSRGRSIGTIISGGTKSIGKMASSVADSVSEMGRSVVEVSSGHRVASYRGSNASPQMMVGGIGVFLAFIIMVLTFVVPDTSLTRKNRINTHCLAQTIMILSAALVIKAGNKQGVTNSIASLVLFSLLPIAVSLGFYYYIDKKEKVSEEELKMLSITPLLSLLFAIYLLYFVDGNR
jgi:hypothetical protein